MHKKFTLLTFMFALTSLNAKDTMIIGHRGAAAYMPENTTSSFKEAIKQRELKKLKDLLPEMRLVPAIVGTPHNLTHSVDELDPYGICLIDLIWSPAVLADAKNRGLKVWTCTMADESKDALERWILAGVDALMVNAPDKAKS